MYDVTIVGCGVVGASLAYTLSQYRLRVLVLERENDVAMGTTKANSAIVHAGYDPENGTLMAKLNVRGSEVMEQLCRDLSVGYKRIGSFVLAFDEEQKQHLEHLLENGVRNGVPGLAHPRREGSARDGAEPRGKRCRSSLCAVRRRHRPVGPVHRGGGDRRAQRR